MSFLLDWLTVFDVALILKLMGIELLVGVSIGVIKKEIARFSARNTSAKQVVSAKGYVSETFGENLPRGGFNLLGVPLDFVVIGKDGDEIVEETFYSLFGDHTSILNGRCTWISGSILSSPTHLLTMTCPMLFGFLGAIFLSWWSPINQWATTYMLSGFGWIMVSNLIVALFTLTYKDPAQ